MKVRAVILVLLVPWLVHAQQAYYGTRLAKVELSGSETPADLQVVPIHPGDVLTPENVRQSIQALYNTGHYSYVEVDADPAGGGVGTDLTFRVRPNFFFSTIRLQPENLLERPLSGYLRLPYGEKYSTSTVNNLVQDSLELLNTEGYFQAVITPEPYLDESTHLAFVTFVVKPGARARVGTVQVHGGEQTFSAKELLDAFGLKKGDEFSSAKADKGITKARTKFSDLGFLNTKVTADRNFDKAANVVNLDLMVDPGQFTLVETTGYRISKKTIRQLVPVFEEGTVDPDLIEEGRTQILAYMQQKGYFEAVVSDQEFTAPLDNAVQITYMIQPGNKHDVISVTIEGNHHFTTDEIRNRMKVRTGHLLNPTVFSAGALNADVRAIEAMYRNAGFESATVKGTYRESENHAITVAIEIDEGKQSPIESVTIQGNQAAPEQELRNAIKLKAGDLYKPGDVEQARAAITQYYYARGYADVRVDRAVEHEEAAGSTGGVRVTFQITEGEAYQIGRIVIAGNTRTKDKIISRNSRLQAYTPYNPGAVLEAQQRLYATGLFTRVDIVNLAYMRPGIRDLLIQVEDAQPILLTYGIGYQEYEHIRGTFEISHNNLFGLNRSLSLRLRGSSREELAQVTYREPRLFNHDLDGFVSAFAEHTERPAFTANRVDGSVQALKRFSPVQNLLFTMGYQIVNLADIRVNPKAEILPLEKGVFHIARVGTSYIRDRRDDPLSPTRGYFNTATFQVASKIFGSQLNFTSLYNLYSTYTPVPRGVFATAVRLGWNHPYGGTTSLPPTERYFAGGSTTLRGFGLDEARLEGGNVMTIANFEYRTPLGIIPIKNVDGAVFYDTGNVFPSISQVHLGDFTHSAGFGLRYLTPLGPVRVDIGFNLNRRINENGQLERAYAVHFTLGNPF
jgi:outer membrane protein assembly complex protein YaeT